jgi:hypothetical protein
LIPLTYICKTAHFPGLVQEFEKNLRKQTCLSLQTTVPKYCLPYQTFQHRTNIDQCTLIRLFGYYNVYSKNKNNVKRIII